MNYTLGLASGFFEEPSAEKWRAAVAAGFTDAELNLPWKLPPDAMLEHAICNHAILREAGVAVTSVHLPFGAWWEPSGSDPAYREDALRRFKGLLDWTGAQGIPIAVLHASWEPIRAEERPARLETAKNSIEILGAYAQKRGIALAIENLPRTCLGNRACEILALAEGAAGICFDVNHLLLETHADFLAMAGPRVITAHFSDYDFKDERHWFPGAGDIDWPALLRGMESAGCAGRCVFELSEDGTPAMGRFTPTELAAKFRAFLPGGAK